MSNYNKSFNFRNGVQVDEDDLIVRGSLVGIGTSVPRSALDVVGNVDVSGLVTSTSLYVSGIATFTDVRIGTGITIYGNAGIISATFYGDGSNLVNIPTSQWVDVNPGTGVTSIYAIGNVGIATTSPTNTFQVGGRVEDGDSGVGISSAGNIRASGIVTASSFDGDGSALTALNASQITSGTISEDRLPENLNVTGIVTAATLEVTQINNTGIATISDLKLGQTNISGIATVGFVTASAGFVNNLTVGVATATIVKVNDHLDTCCITGLERLVVVGVATVGLISASDAHFSGVTTTGTLRATSGIITSLTISNDVTLNNATVTNLNVTGITTVGMMTAPTIHVGVATISVLNVTGLNADVTTSTQFVSGAVRIGYGGTNEIDTLHTDLVLDSAGGTVVVDDNLNVTGITTVTTLRVNTSVLPDEDLGSDLGSTTEYFGAAYVGQINVGAAASNEITTRSNTLVLDSAGGTVVVDDNLNVTGITTVTTLRVNTSVLPDEDLGSDLGSTTEYFGAAYVGQINVGAAASNEITTRSNTLVLDSAGGTVVVDDNLNVTGNTYLTGITTVQDSILPDSDQDAALGSASLRFSDAYVDNIRIGVGSDNEVSTGSGNLKLDSASKLVEVADRFKVTGNTELIGVTTVSTGLVPDTDTGAYLGQTDNSFASAHISGVRVAAASSTTIDTRGGKLILDSDESLVEVSNDLKVNQITNLSGNLYVGTNDFYVDQSNNRIGIGTSSPSNDIEVTRNGNLTVELVSETGTSTLALAQTLGLGNDSGSVSYANGDLSIANRSDTGAINLELAAGTGINTNAFFKVNHKGTTIVSIGDSGVTGINKDEPNHALDVEGNIAVNGYGRVVGVLTIGSGANEVTFGAADAAISGNLTGNVNATSGISTFRNLDVQDTVSIGATLSVTGVGIGSFENGIVVGTSNQVTVDNIALTPLLNVSSGDVHVSGSAVFSSTTSKVGIATTGFLSDDRPGLAAEDSNFPGVNYGVLQVRGDMSVTGYSGGASIFVGGPVGNTTAFLTYKDSRTLDDQNYQYSIGINTHAPRSCLDLGASASPLLLPAMDTARKQYMIDNPPQSRISVYNSTDPDVNLPGSLLFNTSTGRAELGIGNTGIMCGIATLTYNGSDHAAFLPPKMTTANRNAMTSSGIPDGAIIYNSSTNKLQLRASGAWVDLN